jgi:NADH:ubiquinone oxidoreductase subunit 3 (subunit A)
LPFYLVALIFVIFDVELIVLFPFLLLRECVTSVEILIFILFLIGLSGGLLIE